MLRRKLHEPGGAGNTVNASQFNSQVDRVLAPILQKAGFTADRRDFVRVTGDNQLALLHFGGSKYANMSQFTRFMLCFRHTYLRDVWEKVPRGLPEQLTDFPFRIAPSTLLTRAWRKWSYRFELSTSRYDEIDYGRLEDAEALLAALGTAVATKGLKWAEQFTAKKSLKWLEKRGESAFVERIWIEDYRARLNLT